MALKLTQEEFIKKSTIIHNSRFDYSKVKYINSKSKVEIICSIHGSFLQLPYRHLAGDGCSTCSNCFRYNTESFIKKAKEIHNDLYDYSLVDYKNSKNKVDIICSKHGIFKQAPTNHLKGWGCEKCAYEKRAQNRRISFSEFIKLTIPIHKDRYDYPDQMYTNCHTKIKINCKIHGEFLQTPYDHLKGSGCNKCNIKYSRGEKIISIWLTNNNIPFETQHRIFPNSVKGYKKNMYVDFFIDYNNKKYFIEYDGIQHFKHIPFFSKTLKDFELRKKRDMALNKLCENNKEFNLIRIKYTLSKSEIMQKLENIFKIDGSYFTSD